MAGDDTTSAKTLWSQTVLEGLYMALVKNRSDASIVEILTSIQRRGFHRNYIISKVENKVDREAALRVKELIANNPFTL